jgi:hypothetical protein
LVKLSEAVEEAIQEYQKDMSEINKKTGGADAVDPTFYLVFFFFVFFSGIVFFFTFFFFFFFFFFQAKQQQSTWRSRICNRHDPQVTRKEEKNRRSHESGYCGFESCQGTWFLSNIYVFFIRNLMPFQISRRNAS